MQLTAIFTSTVYIYIFLAPIATESAHYERLYERLKLRIPGDVMIGVLFPIHEQPRIKSSFSVKCGNIREQYGIHRTEFLLQTLKKINEDQAILPGITIGVDIRDTCWFPSIALEQCMDFIQTAFIYKEIDECLTKANFTKCVPAGFTDISQFEHPIAALIGPGTSEMTKQVQQVLQLFSIPQIGYSATAEELSNKQDYRYFVRVVPSDTKQAQAIISILLRFNWNYIVLVNSKGFYGDRGKEILKKLMTANEICSETERSIDNKETDEAFIQFTKELFKKSIRAKVIVCFCQGETAAGILKAMVSLGLVGKGYLLIGTDGWSDRNDVLGNVVDKSSGERAFSMAALGSVTIRLHSPRIPEFDSYFMQLSPTINNWNPWFSDFWEEKFGCSLRSGQSSVHTPQCTGNETLGSPYFEQDNKLWLLNSTIYTLALALKRVHRKICGADYRGVCKGFIPVDGPLLLREILQTSFKDNYGELLYFDENGDPPGSYEIFNYQRIVRSDGSVSFSYKQIGEWKNELLVLDDGKIQWPVGAHLESNYSESAFPKGTNLSPIESFCSAPCKLAEIKYIKDISNPCCWICQKCAPNEMSALNNTCIACALGFIPTENRTDCKEIIPTFLLWYKPLSLVSIIVTSIGVLLTVFAFIVFAIYNNSCIVKASTRELMYVMLIGMLMAHVSNFVVVIKPNIYTCTLNRLLPGLAFTVIYGALVTKTNRISRILEGTKKIYLERRRFLSTTSQLVITGLINAIELAIVVVMMILEPPKVHLEFNEDLTSAKKCCKISRKGTLAPLLFGIFLIGMCTLYAIKTRNLPENFNEAKYIGFTMYTTCVVWLSVTPVYLSGYETEFTLSMALSISATIALLLLFMPKIYIILFHPERNVRNAFVTNKDIRCHIGVLQTNIETKRGRFDSESISKATVLENHNSISKSILSILKGRHFKGHEKADQNQKLRQRINSVSMVNLDSEHSIPPKKLDKNLLSINQFRRKSTLKANFSNETMKTAYCQTDWSFNLANELTISR